MRRVVPPRRCSPYATSPSLVHRFTGPTCHVGARGHLPGLGAQLAHARRQVAPAAGALLQHLPAGATQGDAARDMAHRRPQGMQLGAGLQRGSTASGCNRRVPMGLDRCRCPAHSASGAQPPACSQVRRGGSKQWSQLCVPVVAGATSAAAARAQQHTTASMQRSACQRAGEQTLHANACKQRCLVRPAPRTRRSSASVSGGGSPLMRRSYCLRGVGWVSERPGNRQSLHCKQSICALGHSVPWVIQCREARLPRGSAQQQTPGLLAVWQAAQGRQRGPRPQRTCGAARPGRPAVPAAAAPQPGSAEKHRAQAARR